jgi:N-methylhydantoinase A
MTRPALRIAVDIGGTFTDLEVFEPATGTAWAFKVPTTPEDPSIGLMDAIDGAAERFGFAVEDVSFLLHGTTIATNAVLTRNLPEGALITTAGFEDVLEIGRHARHDVYGLRPEPRALLVPRRRRFGVQERIGADGAVIKPLDPTGIDAALERIRTDGIRVVAVALLHAYANPAHERLVRDRLLAADPNLMVSCSHEVSPEIREFERTSTTVLNALLMPVVRGYLDRLDARRRGRGLRAPLYLVQSNGGATSPESAGIAPAKLLLSGPAGGVLAAERVAAELGQANVVAVDMGGTSYDISLIQDGRRATVTQGEVDGLPVRLPMVDMRTIGAGGGSIVFVDEGGRLNVGPRSAGAQPGPVCYRRGGFEPTVTDANVVLGRLDPETFLGGALPLDVEGARAALETRVAAPLGRSVEDMAEGVLAVVVSKLATAIRLSLFERGLDPRDFVLMSFGGAGGLHAAEVAEELGINRVIFPRNPSTFSAHGILMSDVVHDFARTSILPLSPATGDAIASIAAELRREGERRLEADGILPAARRFTLSADMRYRGQAFELVVPIPDGTIEPSSLAADFHALHRQRFSFDDPDETVEVVTLRLSAVGGLGELREAALMSGSLPHPRAVRPFYTAGAWRQVPFYAQLDLGRGARLEGPTVIEQSYTTMIVPEGWSVSLTETGHITATRGSVSP